jgi:hypothetical protein
MFWMCFAKAATYSLSRPQQQESRRQAYFTLWLINKERFNSRRKSGMLLLPFKSVIENIPLPADPPSVSLSYISPPPPDSSCFVSAVPIQVPDPRLEAQYRPRTRLKSEIKYGKLRRI